MLLSSSNRSRGSSRRKRQTAAKSPGSTTTNGSMASGFLDLIAPPNCCSRVAMTSAGDMGQPQIGPELGLGRLGPFLGLDHELVRLLHRAQLVGQADVAGA